MAVGLGRLSVADGGLAKADANPDFDRPVHQAIGLSFFGSAWVAQTESSPPPFEFDLKAPPIEVEPWVGLFGRTGSHHSLRADQRHENRLRRPTMASITYLGDARDHAAKTSAAGEAGQRRRPTPAARPCATRSIAAVLGPARELPGVGRNTGEDAIRARLRNYRIARVDQVDAGTAPLRPGRGEGNPSTSMMKFSLPFAKFTGFSLPPSSFLLTPMPTRTRR